ncbi:MAG TPA: hypothetical protein V6D47_13110 [Oscillatoriaceae cyanobacterium]
MVKGTFTDIKDADIAKGDYDGHFVELDVDQTGSISVFSKDISVNDDSASDRFLLISLFGGKPVAGQTYPVADATTDETKSTTPQCATVALEELKIGLGFKITEWYSTGGSLTIDDITGNTVTFTLKDATMSGSKHSGDTTPAGTFTLNLNGHATGTLAQ